MLNISSKRFCLSSRNAKKNQEFTISKAFFHTFIVFQIPRPDFRLKHFVTVKGKVRS